MNPVQNLVQIGVELEFLVGVPRSSDRPRDPDDIRWPDNSVAEGVLQCGMEFADKACTFHVCEMLAWCGLPVATMVPPEDNTADPIRLHVSAEDLLNDADICYYRTWNREAAHQNDNQPRFDFWHVSNEVFITWGTNRNPPWERPLGYDWYGVEINTPIITNQAELDLGLPSMRRALDKLRRDTKILLNSACGLHVHASPAGEELDLITCQKVATLVVLAEDALLFELCHPTRRSHHSAAPISTSSKIATGRHRGYPRPSPESINCINQIQVFKEHPVSRSTPRSPTEPQIFRMICSILNEPSIDYLKRGLHSHDPASHPADDYNECGRCALAISSYDSFEFRYAEASFDPEFVSLWVELARTIVKIARWPEPEFGLMLVELYDMATRLHVPAWPEWLRAIGLETRIHYCAQRKSAYRQFMTSLDGHGILNANGD